MDQLCFYVYRLYGFFFFFKQKTAYEMRISDWSSDVCSSDLVAGRFCRCREQQRLCLAGYRTLPRHARRHLADVGLLLDAPQYGLHQPVQLQPPAYHLRCLWRPMAFRSEEHTSELQSLMRISYAVFCLKKKTTTYK